jgi:hypothetical protein
MARPPHPVPIASAPSWVTALGGVFGGITLVGLFVLAFFASKDPNFICNAFSLLAAVFSLGAALSAGFIGGAAAVTGSFGSAAQKNALLFSAGGGVAVLILAFLGFNYFKGNNCNLQSIIDTQKNKITLLETEKGDLSKKINELKGAPIVIVVTSSHPTLLKQILIQYNSKTSHGPKDAERQGNVFKIDQNDLTQDDPGIFISYDPSMLPAELEGRPPPISIQRLDPKIDPLRIQLFLDFPRSSGLTR